MIIGQYYWGRGGGLVVEILRRLGVRHLFSIPGAQTLSIWDGLHKRSDISLIVPGSEWDGTYTAIRYASETGRLPVILNTVGPGCVNELPAMAVAKRNRIPLLFITPAQPPYKQGRIETVFQGLKQAKILAPYTGRTLRITPDTHNWGTYIKYAIALTREGQIGPVRLEIEFPLLFKQRLERLIRNH